MLMDFIPRSPDPAVPGSLPPSADIPVAPPPWTLKAKLWTFIYRDINETNTSEPTTSLNPNNAAEILQDVLAPGSYNPMEVIHPDALRRLDNGKSQLNGMGSAAKALLIIRYDDSDVGPYDEVMVIPGFFVNPHTGKRHARISNIYVSTDASVWNGRRNWNIPKHRARFVFEPVGQRDQLVKIYHPEDSAAPLDPKRPFFTALLKGSALPNLPLPAMAPAGLVQPPLAAPRYRNESTTTAAVIATDDPKNGRENPWLMITPTYKGSWGLAYISKAPTKGDEESLESYGDGISLPKMNAWSVGSYFEGIIDFPASKIVS
ncbi:hypothetical protein EYB25_006704 [Talaromyces marneffei]|nr:uncharacterized protein EYB26_007846 [Talaromyces marneffei]KAE8550477.1 hypothetical protein EYB25_006704 [Talaromyces marneffei]QGA20145.1 hypothetical protein EYB26_007846 [Talaromyces marneffei]